MMFATRGVRRYMSISRRKLARVIGRAGRAIAAGYRARRRLRRAPIIGQLPNATEPAFLGQPWNSLMRWSRDSHGRFCMETIGGMRTSTHLDVETGDLAGSRACAFKSYVETGQVGRSASSMGHVPATTRLRRLGSARWRADGAARRAGARRAVNRRMLAYSESPPGGSQGQS